jgi:hypothetical protein
LQRACFPPLQRGTSFSLHILSLPEGGVQGLTLLALASCFVLFLLPAILRDRCPKSNPRVPLRSSGQAKKAGKPQRSAGFARLAHNGFYYWGLNVLGSQSFLVSVILPTFSYSLKGDHLLCAETKGAALQRVRFGL